MVFMTQIAINSVNNKNLFSNYYLDNLIENIPEWKKDDHKDAFQRIKKIYNAEFAFLETLNEKQLEQRFFGPIFKILNHTVEVNESTKFQEFPDYAFFPNRESLDDAHRNKDSSSFYNNAYAIGEVKRWGIELDRFGKDKNDRKRNPSLQIWIYLHDTTPKWGVLSNGAKWRLYYKDRLRDEYFEIDLPTLITTDDIENFRYFYYFFRMEAFLPSKEGDPFLERVLHGSVEYANGIGDDLKDNVYRAMQKIGEGFFNWNQNKLDIQNEATREIVQKNTMLLLYRFLFLLYAEGKGLLDLGNPLYRDSYSFQRLKKEVKEKHDGPQQNRYQPLSTTLWSRLEDLFRLIDQGSKALGTPESNFSVPAYNGGLFDPEKHPELEIWKIGDSYLAEAIDLLSRSNVNDKLDFVDYSTLEIRHLGSIYEGLLEYKLKVSEDEMVVKGGEWCTLETFNKGKKQQKSFSDFDEYNKVTRDQLYLATDKGERKSTGSYYTPDYIVKYIVDNTIGPVVEEKWNEAKAKEQSHVDATLSVKVLDPAMGSGHFLVGAIEFLAGKLLLAAQIDIENGIILDDSHFTDDWARREVVSHCIYGVDLNYMAVELAKVGLWLTTISKDKPLSFLDHRLKQGNSLIGAQLIDLPWYPDLKNKMKKRENTTLQKFEDEVHRPFVDKIVQQLTALSEIDDDTIEHINQKKALFEQLKENKQYLQIKSIADVYTAVYFGNETTEANKNPKFAYNDLFWALKGDDREWSRKTYKPWFKKAMEIARDKSFFHWELEFPEVFFEGGAPKGNPGWDAVVGNPPYDVLLITESSEKRQIEHEIQYFRTVDLYSPALGGRLNIFRFLTVRSCINTNIGGYTGLIIPSAILNDLSCHNLREFLFEKYQFKRIENFPQKDDPKNRVFSDAKLSTCIVILANNDKIEPFYISTYGGKDFDANIEPLSLTLEQVRTFDATNLSIPSVNKSSWGILSKIYQISDEMKIVADSFQGEINLTFIKSCFTENSSDAPMLKGVEIAPYKINLELRQGKKEWLNEKLLLEMNKGSNRSSHNKQLRIATQQITGTDDSRRLKAMIVPQGTYLANSTNYIFSKKYKELFLISLLNSNLLEWRFKITSTNNHVNTYELDTLPIRRISFTTHPDNRAVLVDDVNILYSDFLNNSDAQKILAFVDLRLKANPEETDVVHDLLADLAERMMDMNKEKNIEINGFLNWLEGEIGASVDDFSNKTAIKNYYTHDFETFAKVLDKNKKKLKEGYNLTRRGPKEDIRAEYDTSIGKLAPLLENIKATDGLIDAIVYKMYGLTEDEIKIVESAINGE